MLIAQQIMKEIHARWLQDVGLDYLTLSRAAGTLSGAKPSAFAWPPKSVRLWVYCIFSMSPVSVCTKEITTKAGNPEAFDLGNTLGRRTR